jgi:hypothetical protein
MMKSALLFYRKWISELKGMGFEINPYDPCVVNKMINDSQMTVRWHVDDLMLSHASNEAPSQFLRALKDIYGDNLAENTGKVHEPNGYRFTFFFTLFLSPIFVYFAEKVNPWWLQLNLFLLPPRVIHNLPCWESLLIL